MSSSFTFTLSGRSSILSSRIYPPLEIYDQEAAIALIGFDTYNSIPNVTETNNGFRFKLKGSEWEEILLPVGQYELEDITQYIREELELLNNEYIVNNDTNALFSLTVHKNTLKCVLTSEFEIDFTASNSVGKLLGFNGQTLERGTHQYHQHRLQFVNRFVHQWCTGTLTRVPPGYKILEQPQNLIYLPLSKKSIDEVSVQILDQDGNLVSFADEIVTVRLHLKVFSSD